MLGLHFNATATVVEDVEVYFLAWELDVVDLVPRDERRLNCIEKTRSAIRIWCDVDELDV